MRLSSKAVALLLISAVALCPWPACAKTIQQVSSASLPASSSQQSSALMATLAQLTPEQRQQYDIAGKLFEDKKFFDAIVIYKKLLKAHPGDPFISNFAAESAI